MTPETAVLLENVSYRYPRSTSDTVRGVSLKISRNEIVGITGRTGAGKTSLLTLFNGLIPHFFEGTLDGTIAINGLDTQEHDILALVKHVGMVLQDTETQILGTTVEKDTAFGPSNLGCPRDELRRRVSDALSIVGLSGFEERSTTNLSGGEKQRLAIAGVLAMNPSLIALDEPTSELDPLGSRQLFDLLMRLRETRALTMVLVSHDSEELLKHVHRVLVIDNGSIAWDGKPEELYINIPLCRKFGLRIPPVIELLHWMREKNILADNTFPLDIGEASRVIAPLFAKHNFSSVRDEFDGPMSTPGEPIITIDNLYHQYDSGLEALSGISLHIHAGEFIALVGKNGAGKTTLVKHLNGLLKPSAGSVIVDGHDTRSSSVAFLSRGVGYVFQNPDHQIFCPSVREEIEFGLKQIGNLTPKEIDERVTSSLSFVGLDGSADRHPFTLGKGERQKLAVASVLAKEPKVLVIDEPTTGLDWDGSEKMMQLVQRLHRRGHTILIITHDMQIAAEYAERIVILQHGRILADGTPEEIFMQPELLERASLTLPPIAELSSHLRRRGIDIQCVTMQGMQRIIESVHGGATTYAG